MYMNLTPLPPRGPDNSTTETRTMPTTTDLMNLT